MTHDRHSTYRIALMLKAKSAYGRNIIEGVCDYAKSTRQMWDFLLEEDFRARPETLKFWTGDGVIADFDDPQLVELLRDAPFPVIGIGGSYQQNAAHLRDTPYVASDNALIVRLAYNHLIDAGLERFAFYSIAPTPYNRWAQERAAAFKRLVEADGMTAEILNGIPTQALDWENILQQLVVWLRSLPKPVGIIAATDSRARQVLQACIIDNISVPEEVSIIGIDDDPLLRMLSRIPLSSVTQGARAMGRVAAEMLQKKLAGSKAPAPHVLVPPEGVNAQASSLHRPVSNSYVIRARHYIRLFAAQGVRAGQVAEYVGVSRTTLDAHFQRALGCTVHDEILAFKLSQSRSMLDFTELNLTEIARRSGFNSLQYMYSVYRRELGCTPLEYRAGSRLKIESQVKDLAGA